MQDTKLSAADREQARKHHAQADAYSKEELQQIFKEFEVRISTACFCWAACCWIRSSRATSVSSAVTKHLHKSAHVSYRNLSD